MDRLNLSTVGAPSLLEQPVYQPGRHIAQLDGLRGRAILLVTLYRFGKEMPTDSWLGYGFAQVFNAGQHGVELFFVLSGFLITGILLDSRGTPHQLRNFFIRRSLRILPLYMATLATMTIAIALLSQSAQGEWLVEQFRAAYDQQVYLWLYLTNVQMSLVGSWCFGPLDHFWSLAVEEHFYLVWPIVVVFCLPRHVLRLAVVGAILAIGMRTFWLASGGSATAAEVLTILRCDGLLLGAAIAVLARQSSDLRRYHLWALIGCAMFLLIGFALTCSQRRVLMAGSINWTLGWSALMIGLVTSRIGSPLAWFLDRKFLRNLGQLSYAMYVFQMPLIPVAAWVAMLLGVESLAPTGVEGSLLYVAGMFSLTVALAWCSWHLFEKHWLRLKEIFPQTARRVEPTSMVSPGTVPRPDQPYGLATASLVNIVAIGSHESGRAPMRG